MRVAGEICEPNNRRKEVKVRMAAEACFIQSLVVRGNLKPFTLMRRSISIVRVPVQVQVKYSVPLG